MAKPLIIHDLLPVEGISVDWVQARRLFGRHPLEPVKFTPAELNELDRLYRKSFKKKPIELEKRLKEEK